MLNILFIMSLFFLLLFKVNHGIFQAKRHYKCLKPMLQKMKNVKLDIQNIKEVIIMKRFLMNIYIASKISLQLTKNSAILIILNLSINAEQTVQISGKLQILQLILKL